MAFLSQLLVMLTHPIAFLDNLIRTLKIMTHKYQTFKVVRDSDGLEVKMRKPLDPEGEMKILVQHCIVLPLENISLEFKS